MRTAVSGYRIPLRVMGLVSALVLLAACAPPATPVPPTPAPTPTNTPLPPTATVALPEGGAEWDYVALGDSWAAGYGVVGGRSYVVYYAAHIEADLGVKVTLHNWGRSGLSSGGLLAMLRNNQELRNAISEAEVVTFEIGGNDMIVPLQVYRFGSCGGADNLDCCRERLTSFRANFDAIIAEILSLRSTTDTIIRTMDYGYPWVNRDKELGIYEDLKPCFVEAFIGAHCPGCF
jgi:lysophospholipase L1-like esterase